MQLFHSRPSADGVPVCKKCTLNFPIDLGSPESYIYRKFWVDVLIPGRSLRNLGFLQGLRSIFKLEFWGRVHKIDSFSKTKSHRGPIDDSKFVELNALTGNIIIACLQSKYWAH